MKIYRTHSPKKSLFILFSLLTLVLLTGCSSADTAGSQARTDLTSDHIRGLYSGMAKTDIEDLLGVGDKSLADHESIDVYSLSDGTTALLRYRDDKLMGAYLRDKDNKETSIWGSDDAAMPGINGVNETATAPGSDSSKENESTQESNSAEGIGGTQEGKESES